MTSPIQSILAAYDAAFAEKFGAKAPIVPGKDAKLAQQLLAQYSPEQLGKWLPRFFASSDPFICGSSYSFGVFAACVGKIIAKAPGVVPAVAPDGRKADAVAQALDTQRRRAEMTAAGMDAAAVEAVFEAEYQVRRGMA